MKDSEIIEVIQSHTLLPPTLAAELIQALPTLPTEKVGWIVAILRQAQEADQRYHLASVQIEELLKKHHSAISREAESVAEPVLDGIMAEFDEELTLLME